MSKARKHVLRSTPLHVEDEVIWYTKGRGGVKLRHGRIVMLVPRGCRPTVIMPNCTGTRAAESYVVKDDRDKFHWPPAVDLLYVGRFFNPNKYLFGRAK